MKKFNLFAVFFFTAAYLVFAQSRKHIYSWEFYSMNPDYVFNSMNLSQTYGINTVVFSGDLINYVPQLFDGSGRGQQLKQLADEAHSLGLRVWIWSHELEDIPGKFLKNNVVQMDSSGFEDWLEARYEQVFQQYPDFDGVVLTFSESQYDLFDDSQVHSSLSVPDRFAEVINTIDKACIKYGKDLVVRTFMYEPDQLEWIKEGLQKTDSSVIVESKCVPHDWEPYYPDNPVIGAFPSHRQIIEFDCSSEFTGLNRIPYTAPAYFIKRWKYDAGKPGVVGYDARVDHGGYNVINTPNEINLYTLSQIIADTSLTANEIWQKWAVNHYGQNASIFIENTLKPSFNAVNDSFFALGFWVTNHSNLPSFDYANTHITSRTLSKWIPDNPNLAQLENELEYPNVQILDSILTQKDTAIALAQSSLNEFQKAEPYLTQDQINDLDWRLNLLLHTAVVWRLHAEAFFGLKMLLDKNNAPGIKIMVQQAIDSLNLEAQISDDNPMIGDNPPASGNEIRKVATDLENRLMQILPGSNYIWIEAESADSISLPMIIKTDPSASGGKYIVTENSKNITNAPADGRAFYHFNIDTSGIYTLWGRVIAPTSSNNSFWFKVDENNWIPWNDITISSNWVWDTFHDYSNGDAVVAYNLSKGVHTLTIAYREPGTLLDKILITDNSLFNPNNSTTAVLKNSRIDNPGEYVLFNCYPNPFNPSTTVSFEIPKAGYVRLIIYDLTGRKITTLVNGYLENGKYKYELNAEDVHGNSLASGIYFARLQAGNYTRVIKLLFLK